MKKYLLMVALAFVLSSCDGVVAKRTDSKYKRYKKVCLEGVYYWKSTYLLAPIFNSDSKVQLCVER